MNLAQELVMKSQGSIHSMSNLLDVPCKLDEDDLKPNPSDNTKYLDEHGRAALQEDIANKYGVSRSKVKSLFDEYGDYRIVYQYINVDRRKGNGQRNVYFNDDGISTSSESLGEFYKVSRSTVQRIYRANKKDYRIANPILARFHN